MNDLIKLTILVICCIAGGALLSLSILPDWLPATLVIGIIVWLIYSVISDLRDATADDNDED